MQPMEKTDKTSKMRHIDKLMKGSVAQTLHQ